MPAFFIAPRPEKRDFKSQRYNRKPLARKKRSVCLEYTYSICTLASFTTFAHFGISRAM